MTKFVALVMAVACTVLLSTAVMADNGWTYQQRPSHQLVNGRGRLARLGWRIRANRQARAQARMMGVSSHS